MVFGNCVTMKYLLQNPCGTDLKIIHVLWIKLFSSFVVRFKVLVLGRPFFIPFFDLKTNVGFSCKLVRHLFTTLAKSSFK